MKVSYYLEKKTQGMFIADLIKSNIYEDFAYNGQDHKMD